jgi:hypothetical protein
MDPSQQKERFSDAYLQAVAAVAGCSLSKPSPDDESVDWTVGAAISGTQCRSPRVDVQLKCTSTVPSGVRPISFSVKQKNYNDLRATNLVVPRILVLLTVPSDLGEWVHHSEDQLLLRRCAYWCTLRGNPAPTGKSKVYLKLPRSQVFSPEALTAMMERIANGGFP